MHRTALLLLLFTAPLWSLCQAPSIDAVKQERAVHEVFQGGWSATAVAPTMAGAAQLDDVRSIRCQALAEGNGTIGKVAIAVGDA